MMIEEAFGELKALVEIYKNLTFIISDCRDELNIYFDAEVNLNELGDIFIQSGTELFKIGHFPPLSFHLTLTKDSSDPKLSFLCYWLPRPFIERLTAKIESIIADSTDGLLWNCFQFIENDSVEFLFGKQIPNTDQIIDIEALTGSEGANSDLYEILKDFNKRKLKTVFENSIINCAICMISKRGSCCIELENCHHTFCVDCASEYYNVLIKTGVLELNCLICEEKLQYEEVKCLLATEEFERWDKLLLNQFLKQENGTRPCPRCQISVLTEGDDFGMCSQCGFVFCVVCSKTYHGPGECDEATRRLIVAEEKRLERTTLRCPVCKEGYEKTGGCNKMICGNCQTFFCYICKMVLDRNNPYAHFGLSPKCFL